MNKFADIIKRYRVAVDALYAAHVELAELSDTEPGIPVPDLTPDAICDLCYAALRLGTVSAGIEAAIPEFAAHAMIAHGAPRIRAAMKVAQTEAKYKAQRADAERCAADALAKFGAKS